MFKKTISAFLLWSPILFPVLAQATASVVVCDNSPVIHLQSIDEAQKKYNLNIAPPFSTFKENNQYFSEKMAPLINMAVADVKSTIGSIYSRFRFGSLNKRALGASERLVLSIDSKPISSADFGQAVGLSGDFVMGALDAKSRAHCVLKKISQDDTNDNIQIDQNLWQKLSAFEQSALLFQETFAARDTNYDRKFIAYLFAKTDLKPIMADLPQEHMLCSGGAYGTSMTFYLYPVNDGVRLQFWSLSGQMTFVWTSVFVPGFDYQWLKPGNQKTVQGSALKLSTESQVYSAIPLDVFWDIQSAQRHLRMQYRFDGQDLTSVPFDCEAD